MLNNNEVELELPYKFKPRDYQLSLLKALDSGIKRAVIVWHRRSGKDKVCFNYMVREAMKTVGSYYYFLPTYTQAKKVIWDNIDIDGFKMLDHIPEEIINRRNESELKVELINNSIIQLISADTFDQSSVGTNPLGVVFSEYSISNPKVWDFVRPILMVNKGWAIFNFTPRGVNHAHKIAQIAKENDKWFHELLTIEDTGVLTVEDIENEKKEGMTQDLIDQEFYCKYIEGASSVFRRIDEAVQREYDPNDQLKQGRRYQIGVDLAKYQDFTVITVIDLHSFHIVKQLKFNKLDWNEQKELIVKEVKYWNKGRTWIDSTGLGDPIVDDLKKQIFVEPFKFNEISRTQLLQNLQVLLEQGRIKILNDQELIDELKSMQYELEGMKVKMRVPEGLHDDRIFSLALACWGLSERLPLNIIREAKRKKILKQDGINLRMTSY